MNGKPKQRLTTEKKKNQIKDDKANQVNGKSKSFFARGLRLINADEAKATAKAYHGKEEKADKRR